MYYKNFAVSAVATAPSPASSGTSLVVTSGQSTLFPSAPFMATIWPVGVRPTAANAEVVLVTAVNTGTDTLTITRAQEGSSARTVIVGDWIANTVTAEAVRQHLFIANQTSTVTVASTNSETTLCGTIVPTGALTLPVGFFSVGRSIEVEASGYYGTKTGTVGTLTLRVKLGSTTISATAATSPSASMSNRAWSIKALMTCRTVGGSGTLFSQGEAFLNTSSTAVTRWEMTNTGTNTIDTTATQAISVTAQWATSDAANTITCTNLIVRRIY